MKRKFALAAVCLCLTSLAWSLNLKNTLNSLVKESAEAVGAGTKVKKGTPANPPSEAVQNKNEVGEISCADFEGLEQSMWENVLYKGEVVEWSDSFSAEEKKVLYRKFKECSAEYKKQIRAQRIAAAENAKKTYEASCPRGITLESFDCYKLGAEFKNLGFRGKSLTKHNYEAEYPFLTTWRSSCSSTGEADQCIDIQTVNNIIVKMEVSLRPENSNADAIHEIMKQKFPSCLQQKEIRWNGKTFSPSDTLLFCLQNNGNVFWARPAFFYTIYYESPLLQKSKDEKDKEDKKQRLQNAKELF